MINNEYLPYALSIGVSYETFWTLNPRTLKPFIEAYKIKQEVLDEEMWRMGIYVHEAVGVVLANAFAKKTAKKAEYFKEPLLKQHKLETTELTEEQKLQQVQNLFALLAVRKTNFDLEKGNKK